LEIGSSKVPNGKNSIGLLSSPSEKWNITQEYTNTSKRRLDFNKSPGTYFVN